MAKAGQIGKIIINFGKNVKDGMVGKKSPYTVLDKKLKSNMTNTEKVFSKAVNNGPRKRRAGNLVSKQNTVGYKTGDFLGGGIRDSINHYKSTPDSKKNVIKSLKAGHKNGEQYNTKKLLGTYATASVAGRIATGGGLYRDKDGNVNLPVVPFI